MGRKLRAQAVLCLVLILTCAIAAPIAVAQENSAEEAVRRKAALASLAKDAARRVFGTATTPAPAGAPKAAGKDAGKDVGDDVSKDVGKYEDAGKTVSKTVSKTASQVGGPIVGEYWKGCYAGGAQLAPKGEHWQVMRLSRNRNWGHPILLSFLERFTKKAAEATGWKGLLIGDLSQPRGGPMLTGHSSHQLGIEADIWLRAMPERPLTAEEIEETRSTSLLRADRKDVNPKVYTPQHLALLRAAAREPEVARVFVNAGIKKALCRDAGSDRAWLAKIRPAAGHDYHFHIRLACPKGHAGCIDQEPPPGGDGCGKDLDYWFTPGVLGPVVPGKPGKGMSVSAMPKACQALVSAPAAAK